MARDGLPDVVRAPAGTGKTGVILAWLWRRLHADPEGTPRRLVYALPQRSLVEQVARSRGTAEPFGLTCMSATIPEEILKTVGNPSIGRVVEIRPDERIGELKARLDAERVVRRLRIEPGDRYKAIAAAARERHRAGELTLIVLNTVEAARQVFRQLSEDAPAKCTLLHSWFRAVEREQLMAAITEDSGGRIAVSAQAVEAGTDLNAAVLITEAAPWPSLVQRAGQGNRTGKVQDAELWWISPEQPHPYERADIDAAVRAGRRRPRRAAFLGDVDAKDG